MELILSEGQYELVYNAFSFVIAAMGAAFLFFMLSRNRVAPQHRMAVTISTLVVAIAGYHYFRIFGSWEGGFTESSGSFIANGSFNEGYRYVDWILTVPLLLAELVVVMRLARQAQYRLIAKLGIASVVMVVLGYPGEVAIETGTKWGWWIAGMIPFLYILWVLYGQLGKALQGLSPRLSQMVGALRTLLLISWTVYPLAFLIPLTNIDAATAEVIRQVGYSIADVVAKPVFGVMIYLAARIKSDEDGYVVEGEPAEEYAAAA